MNALDKEKYLIEADDDTGQIQQVSAIIIDVADLGRIRRLHKPRRGYHQGAGETTEGSRG